jgi:S-DNA-T family DNA segregation ATPase FtsK/SpoIIIE
MAKKKKKPVKKVVDNSKAEQTVFWPLAGSILMLVLALFILIGGFGTGGVLPKDLFKGVYWGVGWAGFLTPVALVFFGIIKFKDEKREIPLNRLVGMLAFLALAASWFYVTFATGVAGAYSGGHGGSIGKVIGNPILSVLDKAPASILTLVLSGLMFFFAFGIPLNALLKLGKIFSRPEKDPAELAALKAKSASEGFKLNEGVPVEHGSSSTEPTRNFRNTAQKMVEGESKDALTTTSDPTWKYPPLNLLIEKQDKADAGDVNGNAETIRETFSNFSIPVEMEGANIGPRVTQYTLKPPNGVKLTKITALENNLALDLAAHSIRMEAPIPGKRLVGIEVPNVKPAIVRISSILNSRSWQEMSNTPLGFVIGKDIAGTPVVSDLAKMPHLLIAGQTGSGKSIMINTILTSLIYNNTPAELKLIMVDPKQVELTPYNDIPHLLAPVIHEPEKCISALKWAVAEMDRRLRTMADAGKRNIAEYNSINKDEGMPYIVVVIDELADLMMMAARDVESLIVRLAQKARASGIHLVLATQRPSVDVITGLIKANVPARIAFTTASQIDSRTIIDQMGAEKLLGQGDMLLLTSEMAKPKRVQGAFISDEETQKITDFIRAQQKPDYDSEILSQRVQLNGKGGIVPDYEGDVDDDMWRDAIQVVIDGHKASTSLLQRRLRIGYGRAARLIETMEEQGIVSHADGNRPREVLVSSIDEVFDNATPVASPVSEAAPIQEESAPIEEDDYSESEE